MNKILLIRKMISVISSTNRKGNQTAVFSQNCLEFIKQKNQKATAFNLDQLPGELSIENMYDFGNSTFSEISNQVIEPAEKFLFVIPEYNGSFPGILKLFVDAIHPKHFKGKKAALIGVASGRAGNLRGMDHMADILNHLGVLVMPNKLPVSGLDRLIEEGKLTDQETLNLLEQHIDQFISF